MWQIPRWTAVHWSQHSPFVPWIWWGRRLPSQAQWQKTPDCFLQVTTELTDPKKPFTFIWLRVVSAASPTDYVAMVFWPFTARLVGKTCVSCLNSKLFVQRYLVNGWLLQNTAVTNTAINAATSSLDVCFYGEFVLAASGQNSPLENICVTACWKHKT